METIAYKGCTLHVRKVDATRVNVSVTMPRANGESVRLLKRCESVQAAKAHVTRSLNETHAQALFLNALHDTARGIPTDYAPRDREERASLHHAFMRRTFG